MPEFTYTNIHTETPIGAGYYAVRHMTSQSGNYHQKLVVADRSPTLQYNSLTLEPIVGKRQRIKHRARTCAAANRGV